MLNSSLQTRGALVHRSLLSVLLAAVLMTASGCMLAPFDGQRVAATTSTISFSGYDLSPNQPVSIQAWNFSQNQWVQIGTTTSSATVSLTYPDGSELYGWSYSAVLPAAYWAAGASGHYARVRSMGDGYNFISVRGDWGSCFNESPTVTDFSNNCRSHRNPEAYVYTNDYQHGPPGCANVPAVSKTRYTLAEIPACQRAAIFGLQQQYINRDVVLGHYDINHSLPASFFGDHRKYLQGMEKYLMVYGNKWLPSGRIPLWDSGTAIPAEFTGVKMPPAGQNCFSTSSGCTGWYYAPLTNTNPAHPRPSNLLPGNVCQYTTLDQLFHATHHWHNQLHTKVGGTMGTFDSPAAPIFWNWHTLVDQIWRDWEACP
jgi:hypothetical protein